MQQGEDEDTANLQRAIIGVGGAGVWYSPCSYLWSSSIFRFDKQQHDVRFQGFGVVKSTRPLLAGCTREHQGIPTYLIFSLGFEIVYKATCLKMYYNLIMF